MSKTHNKFGLSRKLSPDAKQELRVACGFGCVVCGNAFCDDAHLDPPFSEAKCHDINKMALLCKMHHPELDYGDFPMSAIHEARSNPCAIRDGYAHKPFFMEAPLTLVFGNNEFHDVSTIIQTVSGDRWFTIKPSTENSRYPQIDAKFFARDGSIDFEICENIISTERMMINQWRASTAVWDAVLTGHRDDNGTTLVIKKGPSEIIIKIRFKPPHTIIIDRMKMLLHGTGIEIKDTGDVIFNHAGSYRLFSKNYVRNQDSVFLIPDPIKIDTADSRRFSYECNHCGDELVRLVKIDNRNAAKICQICKKGLLRIKLNSNPTISSANDVDDVQHNADTSHNDKPFNCYFHKNHFKGANANQIMSVPNSIYFGNMFEP